MKFASVDVATKTQDKTVLLTSAIMSPAHERERGAHVVRLSARLPHTYWQPHD